MDALRAAARPPARRRAAARDRRRAGDAGRRVVARVRPGQPPLAPDAVAEHATDYLRMVRGAATAPRRARALDAYLVTVIDHGMNASTFTARVVASTGSDLVSAVVAAHRRAQGAAARRRARAGARHARRDRRRRRAPRRGSTPSSPPAGASWAWAIASIACAIRAPRCSSARSSGSKPLGVAHGRLALARAVERAAEGVLAQAPPRSPAPRQRRVLHGGAARRASACRASCSRRRSRSGASPAGARTSSSSARTGG